ncbi:MAG: response regulator [Lachnospiraceae bacterium]
MSKILVVDDDAMNLRMAEFMLQKKSYEVVKVDSGAKAVDLLEKETVDLILLDIEMPDMNGFEAYEKIREKGITTPVMFLSASTEESVIQKAMDMGAVDYVKKPFVPQVLYDQIEKVL